MHKGVPWGCCGHEYLCCFRGGVILGDKKTPWGCSISLGIGQSNQSGSKGKVKAMSGVSEGIHPLVEPLTTSQTRSTPGV